MACRGCQYLDVPLDKLGRRIPKTGFVYGCKSPLPAPDYPDSIRLRITEHMKCFMRPDEGKNCPSFKSIIK